MTKKKILIVDDKPDILRLAVLRLKNLGYDIVTAVDGSKAYDIIQNEELDLILLDLIMPLMYGTEICKRVKNDENLKHIPIILFTAHSDIMTAEKAKNFGADGYITKPFEPEELVIKIEEFLAQGAPAD
jgi:CheY-like chemotaxis protein